MIPIFIKLFKGLNVKLYIVENNQNLSLPVNNSNNNDDDEDDNLK